MKKIEPDSIKKRTKRPFRTIDSFGISLNLFKIIRIIIQNYISQPINYYTINKSSIKMII
jgi:hypothetical protein